MGDPPKPRQTPYPSSPSSSLFKDISNFKTPISKLRHSGISHTTPQFFTASQKTLNLTQTRTPSTATVTARRRIRHPVTSTSRRLKEFELEQSKASRREQLKKERSMRSLAKSLTAWLNFLFENPRSCGCEGLAGESADRTVDRGLGKRESRVGVSDGGRLAKRVREEEKRSNEEFLGEISKSKFGNLRESLKEVCSFDDLKERMRGYLSLDGIKEVFNVMTLVVKNIDEGRLKMKAHCPIVTDVGMKEKTVKILTCYNPIWLRIGLYIIFGGESLLQTEESSNEQEMAFLKMVIEKQFFSHAGLAKTYAYNKLVDGLYRPGYFETLGNVLLKRFLLLVLVLDRAKSQSSLPVKYGIDGLDGGSPLLFNPQSNIKSSQKMIHDFLSSEVMHGEGNLLAHLVIVGYKVSHQQIPLMEYDFRITDLFQDIQDGVRLCRAIQLLKNDSSILTKVMVPADTTKKKLANCSIAMQYLKQAGVRLQDDDGMVVVEDDIASGDKELTISLLWNMFVHMQLPLLITKTSLSEEISNIQKADREYFDFDASTHLNMLHNWMKAICTNYGIEVESLTSLVDGKAMWCLLDFYFQKDLQCACSVKDIEPTEDKNALRRDATDAVHNFVLSQKITTLLGNFPEVLQICDILEYNGACSDRSVVILLVFLSSQLVAKNAKDQLNLHKLMGCHCRTPERRRSSLNSEAASNKEREQSAEDAARKFKAVKAWWQEMAKRNANCITKQESLTMFPFSTSNYSSETCLENAAIVIQSHFRRVIEHKKYLKIKSAVACIQSYTRAWLIAKQRMKHAAITTVVSQEKDDLSRKIAFMIDRHNFIRAKCAATLIRKATRHWILHIHLKQLDRKSQNLAAIVIQSHFRGVLTRRRLLKQKQAAIEIQSMFRSRGPLKDFQRYRAETKAAIVIQSHLRGWIVRRNVCQYYNGCVMIQSHCRRWLAQKEFTRQKEAAVKVQCAFRRVIYRKDFISCKCAVIEIQRFVRGSIERRRLLGSSICLSDSRYTSHTSSCDLYSTELKTVLVAIVKLQRWWKRISIVRLRSKAAVVIQSYVRGYMCRKKATLERQLALVMQMESVHQKVAAVKVQSAFRRMICQKDFSSYKRAAIEIQRFVRGSIERRRLLGSSICLSDPRYTSHTSSSDLYSTELKTVLVAIVKLQRWWKRISIVRLRSKAAVVIQSYVRGYMCRKKATLEKQHALVIQAHWKGYVARKDAKDQLHDLRSRIQKSAANVNDGMRIINKLIAALKELKSMKNVSGILHNCATLDTATAHSRRCCERLVDEGAIDILLYQIRSVTRSIPDQEVLKHCLSTLRNLARYPDFLDVLVDHQRSVETILWELLRNKEDGFFIACDLLKKLCTRPRGTEAICNQPSMLKRLHALVEELNRKANHEKRKQRGLSGRDTIERRSREATELLNLITLGKC